MVQLALWTLQDPHELGACVPERDDRPMKAATLYAVLVPAISERLGIASPRRKATHDQQHANPNKLRPTTTLLSTNGGGVLRSLHWRKWNTTSDASNEEEGDAVRCRCPSSICSHLASFRSIQRNSMK